MSNDSQMPVESRRNYKSVFDCAVRIARDEGISTFWRGSAPFVNRAMLVGVTQVRACAASWQGNQEGHWQMADACQLGGSLTQADTCQLGESLTQADYMLL